MSAKPNLTTFYEQRRFMCLVSLDGMNVSQLFDFDNDKLY